MPPALVFFLVGGWGASRMVNRLGAKRTILVSAAFISLGTLLLTPMSPSGSALTLMPGLMVWALGASIGFPAVNIAAVAGTKHGEEGLAAGVVNTSFRVGFPVGLAVLLTVAGVFDPSPVGPATSSAIAAGVVAGFQVAMIAASLLGILGFVIALRLKEIKPQWGAPDGNSAPA